MHYLHAVAPHEHTSNNAPIIATRTYVPPCGQVAGLLSCVLKLARTIVDLAEAETIAASTSPRRCSVARAWMWGEQMPRIMHAACLKSYTLTKHVDHCACLHYNCLCIESFLVNLVVALVGGVFPRAHAFTASRAK